MAGCQAEPSPQQAHPDNRGRDQVEHTSGQLDRDSLVHSDTFHLGDGLDGPRLCESTDESGVDLIKIAKNDLQPVLFGQPIAVVENAFAPCGKGCASESDQSCPAGQDCTGQPSDSGYRQCQDMRAHTIVLLRQDV